MSAETTQAAPHDPHHGHDTTAPDDTPIHIGKVLAVGAASLALFAIGGVWALKILAVTEKEMNPNGYTIPAAIKNEENGIVDFVPFELNTWKAKDVAAAHAKLTGYAWVDKHAGVVQIPIDRAMELVVAEQGKPGPTGPVPMGVSVDPLKAPKTEPVPAKTEKPAEPKKAAPAPAKGKTK